AWPPLARRVSRTARLAPPSGCTPTPRGLQRSGGPPFRRPSCPGPGTLCASVEPQLAFHGRVVHLANSLAVEAPLVHVLLRHDSLHSLFGEQRSEFRVIVRLRRAGLERPEQSVPVHR